MRAVWITKYGGPEVLQVRESDDPEPGPGEARIRVRAAGLNFAEVMARQNLYPDAPKAPTVVGYEAAGVVDALGEGVTEPPVGSRVLCASRFGAHADTLCVPAEMTFVIPDDLPFEQAAAIPVNYLTAWHMLFEVARVRAGDRVLVHMAAGGVGTAVLQLARSVEGLTTFGTASARKHDYVREHGCDHPIDYRSLDYAEEIRRLTDGRGVHFVLDPLGGRDWKKGYELLEPTGLLIAFGFSRMHSGSKRNMLHVMREATGIPFYTPMGLMSDNRGIAGVNMGHLFGEIELLRGELAGIMEQVRAGRVRPHVHEAVPFSRAGEAHRMLEEGDNLGKVVLVPD
ncbi:MAG: synaptic vesicle VAT-1 family membrane protein [Polyangiales bacterium]